jgi:hypothetical protein
LIISKNLLTELSCLARVNSALKLSDAQKSLLESEKRDTFFATVVTANHKIKQPLTLLSLSSTAIRRELGKNELSKEAILKRVNYIEIAVKEITAVLDQLNAIKDPVISNYTKDIKMIKVDEEIQNEKTK